MMDVRTLMGHTNQGLDVFQFYILEPFKVGKAFSSPMREDKHPSFSIYCDKESGRYLFKDYATGQGGDCVDFVSILHQLDFKDAMVKIFTDLRFEGAGAAPTQEIRKHPPIPKHPSSLEFKSLETFELDFWEQYGVDSKILQRYHVMACVGSTPHHPKFAYQFEWGTKVYMPNSQQRFFYNGDPGDYLFGWDQLPNKAIYLIFAAGEKDVLTLSSKGYAAICLNSETKDISEALVKELKRRFKYLLICYDVDQPGLAATVKHQKAHADLISIRLPLPGTKDSKDVSDFFKTKGTKEQFDLLIRQSIKERFRATIVELGNNQFDFHRKVSEPVPVCKIGDSKILTLGNIAVIAGKSKSGKSALCQSTISGAIAKNENGNFLGIEVTSNFIGLPVIHFDTEQSSYDYSRKVRDAIYDAGYQDNVPFFKSYHLLEFSPKDRLRYLQHIIDYHAIEFGGIYLIIIDGVADLVQSVNDEETANEVVDQLHRMATELNCGVLVVLHLNPDGVKTRGHLGSQLDRKSETVLVVEKEGDTCTINAKYCRNASFTSMGMPKFKWRDDLKKFTYDGEQSTFNKIDKKIAECEDCLLLAKNTSLSWARNALREFICAEMKIGRSAAFEIINFMIEQMLLTENTDDGMLIIKI